MAYKIKSNHGTINFEAGRTPSQCGMTFIHNVNFTGVTNKQKLYEFFLNEVIFGKKNLRSILGSDWGYESIDRDNGIWNVNKYLLTDYKRTCNETHAYLYDFCKTMGALEGDLVPNPNSGNMVRSFEFNRKSVNEKALDGKKK